MVYIIVGIILLSSTLTAVAQRENIAPLYTNLKSITFPNQSGEYYILDPYILPGTIHILNIPSTCYFINQEMKSIKLSDTCDTIKDSIHVWYRVMPPTLSNAQSLNKYNYDSTYLFKINPNYWQTDISNFVNNTAIKYTGSYSRSMHVGNGQDMSMNANFNMVIGGYLLDSIKVEGAITDNNIPFQPDGTTQRIQEFDKVFITLEKKKHKLTLGDYNLENPKSYFLNYNKRVQGAYYETKDLKIGNTYHQLGLSASASKGQFARNIFDGIEGNQGPYKLTGNNGEQFFILLAGTERVYIDGVLLERGEDRDYIINYNLGEIIFMPRILITKDKRIQVEFEYQDRNYLNAQIFAYDQIKVNDKLSLNWNIYANQDARNQPINSQINDQQKRFLHEIGDNIQEAYYQNIVPDTFATNKILYKMVDTMVAGITYDSIFVYSTDPDDILYDLSFSYVGENKGNYSISSENSNGRSYRWIAPIDGVPKGAYEPVILLITPKKHHIYTLGGQYLFDTNKVLNIETSLSNYDPNLYSTLQQDEHTGLALKVNYNERRHFNKDSLSNPRWSLSNTLDYEYVQSNYKAIAPYRNIEFNRDWNITGADSIAQDEHFLQWRTQASKNNLGNVQYGIHYYKRGNNYDAWKHDAQINLQRKHTSAGIHFNQMQSKSIFYNTNFLRPNIYIEHRFPNLNNATIGAAYQLEHNTIHAPHSDTLLSNAYSFDVYKAYIKGGKEETWTYQLQYTARKDRQASVNGFKDKNLGQTIDFQLQINHWKNHQLSVTGGYRHLEHFDSIVAASSISENTLVGRINYNGNIRKGFIIPTMLYEFGSGQEQKRAFTFVEVPLGQGMYYWIDYNEDGIQQANEFEIGIYPDQKKYIKVVTPTNEYNKVNYFKMTASLAIQPNVLFAGKEKNGFGKFISRFSNQFSAELDNRVLATEGWHAYNPFYNLYSDTGVITQTKQIINTFFFNRSNPKFGVELLTRSTQLNALLTYGLEKSQMQVNELNVRYNPSKKISLQTKGNLGFKSYQSGISDGRTYHYDYNTIHPSVTYLLTSKARITTGYERSVRTNAAHYGGEIATLQSIKIDTRWSFNNYGSIQLSGNYTHIDFNGDALKGVGVAMLDALRIGQNWIWELQWNTTILKGVEMSLLYNGRKPAETKVIHTGNVSIRAML